MHRFPLANQRLEPTRNQGTFPLLNAQKDALLEHVPNETEDRLGWIHSVDTTAKADK